MHYYELLTVSIGLKLSSLTLDSGNLFIYVSETNKF